MRKITVFLNLLALLSAAWMTYQLLTRPMYTGIETITTESGTTTVETSQTLVEVNGRWVFYNLVGLVIASGVPLLASLVWPPSQRWVTWLFAILLLVYSIKPSVHLLLQVYGWFQQLWCR